MKLKPIAAIIVLFLVVTSLLVAGCTTSTTSNTNQTPSTTTSTSTHDTFLENYLVAYKTNRTSDAQIKAWEVTWINSTSARLESSSLNKSTNATVSFDETFAVFPTTQNATSYLNAMNKTAYSLNNTQYPRGGAYEKTTGHAPQVYKSYVWNEGNPFNISEYKRHEIVQLDNLVIIATQTHLVSAFRGTAQRVPIIYSLSTS